MKFFTFILMFLFVGTTFAQDAGANSFNADGTVKSRRSVYTFVKNSASVAFSAGEVVCHDLTADDGISADYCSAYGEPAYCMITEAVAVGAMGKCLLEGYTSVLSYNSADDNAVAGKSVFASGTAGDAGAKTTVVAGEVSIGTYLDAASATGAVEAYMKF